MSIVESRPRGGKEGLRRLTTLPPDTALPTPSKPPPSKELLEAAPAPSAPVAPPPRPKADPAGTEVIPSAIDWSIDVPFKPLDTATFEPARRRLFEGWMVEVVAERSMDRSLPELADVEPRLSGLRTGREGAILRIGI